jgi:hypothetical protein
MWPTVTSAQVVESEIQTPAQVREQFVSAGYLVDRETTWWNTGVTTFTVRDASPTDRVLMVLVYPDNRSAEIDRTSGAGLVPGYGKGEWQGNVALVQGSQRELSKSLPDEAGLLPLSNPFALSEAPIVDPDLLAVIVAPARVDL